MAVALGSTVAASSHPTGLPSTPARRGLQDWAYHYSGAAGTKYYWFGGGVSPLHDRAQRFVERQPALYSSYT